MDDSGLTCTMYALQIIVYLFGSSLIGNNIKEGGAMSLLGYLKGRHTLKTLRYAGQTVGQLSVIEMM